MTCVPTVHLADEIRPGLTCQVPADSPSDLRQRWSVSVVSGCLRSLSHGPGTAPRHLFPVHTAARRSDSTAATGLGNPAGKELTAMSATLSPEVAAELDDLADTARTVHEINARNLDAASEALDAARARFEAASAAWDASGEALDTAARKATAARDAAAQAGLMTEAEARQFRHDHDEYVRWLSRKSRFDLKALLDRQDRADGFQRFGGPSSKDELIRELTDREYPLGRLNESIHVLHHKPGESWSACKHCSDVTS